MNFKFQPTRSVFFTFESQLRNSKCSWTCKQRSRKHFLIDFFFEICVNRNECVVHIGFIIIRRHSQIPWLDLTLAEPNWCLCITSRGAWTLEFWQCRHNVATLPFAPQVYNEGIFFIRKQSQIQWPKNNIFLIKSKAF